MSQEMPEALAPAPVEPLSLWYRQPATEWVEALPIGNGRLGAMVFGGADEERLQLNEDTFWSGGPYDPSSPEALEALPEARRLILEGDYATAQALIEAQMMGRPKWQCSYQPIGDLWLRFPEDGAAPGYRRDLNLDTAVSTVTYLRGGLRVTREVFASPTDQVIVMRLCASEPGCISLVARLSSPQDASVRVDGGDTLVLCGSGPDGPDPVKGVLRFECRARVLGQGGSLTTSGDSLTLSRADSALILLDAATSYVDYRNTSADPA
jgi:alpha-L-fucosidase 2